MRLLLAETEVTVTQSMAKAEDRSVWPGFDGAHRSLHPAALSMTPIPLHLQFPHLDFSFLIQSLGFG